MTRPVMNHPAISCVLSMGLLVACAYPVLDMDIGVSGVDTLPEGTMARDGIEVLAEEFPPGMAMPLYVVIDQYDRQDVRNRADLLQSSLTADPDYDVFQFETNPEANVAVMSVTMTGDAFSPEAQKAATATRVDALIPVRVA